MNAAWGAGAGGLFFVLLLWELVWHGDEFGFRRRAEERRSREIRADFERRYPAAAPKLDSPVLHVRPPRREPLRAEGRE